MNTTSWKKQVCAAIDRRSQEIIGIGNKILAKPEVGYNEHKTSELVAEHFRRLGAEYQDGLGITGVKAYLETDNQGPTVAVLGELDALVCPMHPHADPTTGAAHTCGHNAQIAMMLGVGMGLVDSGVLADLAGCVVLLAVPAEEYVDIENRRVLREDGTIEFFGGKAELVRNGVFDDIDMAMILHAMPGVSERRFAVGGTCNGFLAKAIRFRGVASHAGARPEAGINALNAAALGILGVHAQRETFRDEDAIRVHFVMTKGGDLVNIVPDDVTMELFVRGKTLESILDAAKKVDRALQGGATMVGATVEIEDLPGYLPLLQDKTLADCFFANAEVLVGKDNVWRGGHMAASTDMGDISHLIPAIHPAGGGYAGMAHNETFAIVDEEMAYVTPAKALAMTVVDLLTDGAALAQQTIDDFSPTLTKAEYLTYLRGGELKEQNAAT
ncbi:amidohydrolase [bacterium]|nr:amidohydrolase [bacterium]